MEFAVGKAEKSYLVDVFYGTDRDYAASGEKNINKFYYLRVYRIPKKYCPMVRGQKNSPYRSQHGKYLPYRSHTGSHKRIQRHTMLFIPLYKKEKKGTREKILKPPIPRQPVKHFQKGKTLSLQIFFPPVRFEN